MHFPENCERCGAPLGVIYTSYFNTDSICAGCVRRERAHPQYAAARAAEDDAVRGGNLNFPGIGLPPELRQPERPKVEVYDATNPADLERLERDVSAALDEQARNG